MGSLSRKIQKSQNESTVRRIKTAHEAYQEGMAAGYKKGHKEGYVSGATTLTDGLDEALYTMFDRISTLEQVNDIGPKRYQKILNHLNIASKEQLLEGLKGRK
jgi:flagellar biosynthesis/type III secretory pathway protein FliH